MCHHPTPHTHKYSPHPGVPSNLELSCSQSRSVCTQSQVHVPSDNLSGISQNSQLKHLQRCHKFTDGKRIFTQATDNDTPSPCNRVYVGLGRPQMSEEQPTENHDHVDNVVDPQVTDVETTELIRNGYFPSVDTCRCQLDSLIKRLVYCSEVSYIAGLCILCHNCRSRSSLSPIYSC